MMTYRFTCDYASNIGAWSKGDTVDLDDQTAAWLLRDVPDCIEPVAPSRIVDRPPHDRQMKSAPKKRGAK